MREAAPRGLHCPHRRPIFHGVMSRFCLMPSLAFVRDGRCATLHTGRNSDSVKTRLLPRFARVFPCGLAAKGVHLKDGLRNVPSCLLLRHSCIQPALHHVQTSDVAGVKDMCRATLAEHRWRRLVEHRWQCIWQIDLRKLFRWRRLAEHRWQCI